MTTVSAFELNVFFFKLNLVFRSTKKITLGRQDIISRSAMIRIFWSGEQKELQCSWRERARGQLWVRMQCNAS